MKDSNIDKELIDAIDKEDIYRVIYSISKKADVNQYDDYPLRLATKKGNYQITKLLIEHGADVNAESDEAITNAAFNKNFELVKLLLDNNANIKTNKNYVLREFCSSSTPNLMEKIIYFLEHGADAHDINPDTLINAMWYVDLKTINYLIKQGADFSGKDNIFIKTAALNDFVELVQYLIVDCHQDINVLLNEHFINNLGMKTKEWAEEYKARKDLYNKVNKDLHENKNKSIKTKI